MRVTTKVVISNTINVVASLLVTSFLEVLGILPRLCLGRGLFRGADPCLKFCLCEWGR